MTREEKKQLFDELSNELKGEEAKPSRSDAFERFFKPFFVFEEPEVVTKKQRERFESKDTLRNYAELVREGCTRRQLWDQYPDDKWVRDPRKMRFWENVEEPEPFLRRTELAHRSALAAFDFGRWSAGLVSVSVRIDPITCTNQNSEADVLLWRSFRAQLPAGYEFKLRRELANTLVLGGEYESCDFEVRFGRTKSRIRLSARISSRDEENSDQRRTKCRTMLALRGQEPR